MRAREDLEAPSGLSVEHLTIAIVGSRGGLAWASVKAQIGELVRRDDVSLVVSGGATGVDSLGESMALAAGKRVHSIRPNWEKFGRSAGFRRNVSIVEMADEVHAFWDGKSRGTRHAIDIATKMGKPLVVYKWPSVNTVQPSVSEAFPKIPTQRTPRGGG